MLTSASLDMPMSFAASYTRRFVPGIAPRFRPLSFGAVSPWIHRIRPPVPVRPCRCPRLPRGLLPHAPPRTKRPPLLPPPLPLLPPPLPLLPPPLPPRPSPRQPLRRRLKPQPPARVSPRLPAPCCASPPAREPP